MENAFEWGMEWIIWLQAVGTPAFKAFFEAVTFMGEEYFFLIFVPILFWSVDARAGARVGFAFLISVYMNAILKVIVLQPRPYHVNPAVSDHTVAGSGMPSGHAQSSIFVWGVLAAQVKRRWFWLLAIVIAFLIGFSRVYLGVHYPHQVLAGWAVGAVLLLLFLYLDPRIERAVARLALAPQLLLAIGIPLLLVLFYPLIIVPFVKLFYPPYPFGIDAAAAAVMLRSGANDTITSPAVMAGLGSGLVLSRRCVPFSAAGLWWQRVLRSAIGLAVLITLYIGLSAIFPGEEAGEFTYQSLRFVRYAVLGLWITLGAPWLFSLLHLLQPQLSEQPQQS